MSLALPFDNSYGRLPNRFYTKMAPSPVASPAMLALNVPLAGRLGIDADALATPEGVSPVSSWLPAVPGPPLVTRLPDFASGTCFGLPVSLWLASFAPVPPPTLALPCSAPSSVLPRHPNSAIHSSSSVQILSLPTRPRHDSKGGPQTSQVPAMDVRTCDGSWTPRGSFVPRQSGANSEPGICACGDIQNPLVT